jgi:exonuclease SbcD
MKLLHVSDWHLGRTTYNASRVEDHDKVLAEILDLARQEKPDLVLHTGDLFESIRPAYEDMDRGVRALQALAEVAPVVVLCGNHDSPALFRLFNDLLGHGPAGAPFSLTSSHKPSRIRFIDRPRPADDGGVLSFPMGRGGDIHLATLPFVHANRMVRDFEKPETWMAAYADRVQQLQQNLSDGLVEKANLARDVLVFAAHLHVAGATFSHSERQIHVTDTYASRVEHVPKVSYAAFGHIHKPQPLPQNEKGWFAGSPIPLDFGEIGEQKFAIVVEAEPGRPPSIQPVPLSGGRPLRKLEGTLDALRALAPSVGKALCLVTVHTEAPVPDLSEQVRQIFPQATVLQVAESCSARKAVALCKEDVEAAEPSFEEMFREYLAENGTKAASVDRVLSTFSALLAAVDQEEKPTFPEEALFASLDASLDPKLDPASGAPAPPAPESPAPTRTGAARS